MFTRPDQHSVNQTLRRLAALPLFLLALHVAHAGDKLPDDVARYLERRELCDHWRGEEGYDADRQAEIQWGLCQSCPGSDAGLARLKGKYRADKGILDRLADFEPTIEAGTAKERKAMCRNVPKTRPTTSTQ